MAENDGSMYGPMLIGVLLNCVLYGVTLIQVVLYFQTFKSDKWWIKLFVLYLLVCETLNTAFDAGIVYEPLILRYATPRVDTVAPKMLATNPLMTVMISFPVQLFIAWRLKFMSKSYILPAIICFFAIASFAGGVATTTGVILIHLQYSKFAKNYGSVITWLASSAAADLIITASLVYSLVSAMSSAIDDVINRVIRLTVQTGLITAVSATIDVTLFLLLKGDTWNYIWDFALCKLYSNTILSSLNARGGWKATSTMRDNVLFGNGTGGESAVRNRPQIEVVTTVTTDYEPRHACMVPMKALDSEMGYSHEYSDCASAMNVTPVYTEAV